jgi:hypothetical protein
VPAGSALEEQLKKVSEEALQRQEEADLLRKLSPGETLEENMWRDKLARLVEAYSKLQQWELEVLTSQSQKEAHGHRHWWQKRRHGEKDRRKRFVATELDKMCARFLSHNELLSKRDESPWNRLLLKLIFESLTIARVAERQEQWAPAEFDDEGGMTKPKRKVTVPMLRLEEVDEEDRLVGKVSGVKLEKEYIGSVQCSL